MKKRPAEKIPSERLAVAKSVQAEPSVQPEPNVDVWSTRVIEPAQHEQLPARARPFIAAVNKENSEFGLSAELLLAIIETESAFNPMAKSSIPAFGLMQIVPASAGQDATEKLFGKPRLLAPSYLYNADNNIRVGAAYFNILYYRYFKGIENPVSRLYCAIAAYNTGPGNVSLALTGEKMRLRPAIAIANKMTSSQVYEHLLQNLPYEETINYLQKVNARLGNYTEALSNG
ncbi:murein transglycosylase [Marinobacter similis]|uniref:Murein transglycosylase n=1 Tax=Marinobacter similis TaxID=1420916 RepID=W5YIS1_9GAMM|nr:murein transglycosylase [Marinobacter similis]